MNANQPAFPVPEQHGQQRDAVSGTWEQGYEPPCPGLTKREYLAAMAMEGIIAADVNDENSEQVVARVAVKCADALLAELEKERSAEK